VSRTVGASGFTIEPVVGCRRFGAQLQFAFPLSEVGAKDTLTNRRPTNVGGYWEGMFFDPGPGLLGWGQGEADSRQLPSGWDQQASHGRIEVRMQHWGHGENWGRCWSSLAGGLASKERPCSGGWGMAVRCPRG
jgi:hypothetical protein